MALLSAMLTNAAAPAILALAPLSAMLTNTAAPALLAHTHPSAMLTTVLPCFLFGWHFERSLYRRVALFLESGVLFAAAAATKEQSHGAADAPCDSDLPTLETHGNHRFLVSDFVICFCFREQQFHDRVMATTGTVGA